VPAAFRCCVGDREQSVVAGRRGGEELQLLLLPRPLKRPVGAKPRTMLWLKRIQHHAGPAWQPPTTLKATACAPSPEPAMSIES
jgi:hypothetical protein